MINPQRLSPAKINRIQQLYKADYNYAEIARMCDVGYKAVHHYCTRIKPHPRHRPPAEMKRMAKFNQTIQARNGERHERTQGPR